MPLLILSMGVAEPLTTRRAAHARRVGAFHSDSRDALTRPLQVRALVSLFSHRNDTPRATFYARVGLLEQLRHLSGYGVYRDLTGTQQTLSEAVAEWDYEQQDTSVLAVCGRSS